MQCCAVFRSANIHCLNASLLPLNPLRANQNVPAQELIQTCKKLISKENYQTPQGTYCSYKSKSRAAVRTGGSTAVRVRLCWSWSARWSWTRGRLVGGRCFATRWENQRD
nr:hypothetical protein Iba_chr14dCG11420 [Ipomoea batatas]